MTTRPGSTPAIDRPSSGRRFDPDRRDRIIDACLDVIARDGLAGTSHRKIAAAADIPLGSMTYHFTGMDELLHAAFDRFAHTVSAQFDKRMATVTTRKQGRAAVLALITEDVFSTRRELVLTQELYTLAARNPAYRDITHRWMTRSRAALERVFDPDTARMLDALLEGLTLHRALDTAPYPDELIRTAITQITGRS